MGEGVPLQAIILADSITSLFEPITLDCPKVKVPSSSMIDHKLAWLESANVEEVFVLCSSSHSKQILNYLDTSKWDNKPNFSVTIIESNNCITACDALRNMIRSDFILVSGDTVTNMMLTQALKEHKENNAMMTMVIKQSKPCQVGPDELIIAIDPTTKQLLDYEDKTEDLRFDNSFLTVNPCYSLHNDKQDFCIDICSPQVLSLFSDINNHNLRRDFVKGLLADDKLTIFTHEIHSSYYAEFLIKNIPNPTPTPNPTPNPTELELNTESYKMESKDEKFEKWVEEIFLEEAAYVRVDVDNIRSRLQRVRMYYSIGLGKCAGVLLNLVMKLALDNSNNSGIDLVKEIHCVFLKWRRLPFSRGVDEKIQMILKLEEICLGSMKEYALLFVQVLCVLYVHNVIEEEAILKWAKDKDESDNVFVKQSENFIQWLKESSEENYQQFQATDLKRLNEGGVQVKKKKSHRMRTDLKRLNEEGVHRLSIC